jgi:hypothetical protein
MGQYTDGRFETQLSRDIGMLHSNRTAASEVARIRFSTQTLVKEVSASVLTAGTATTAGFTVLKNTSSIGAVITGTQTAGSVVIATLADTTFASTDALVLKNITSDLNMDARVWADYQELFSAT